MSDTTDFAPTRYVLSPTGMPPRNLEEARRSVEVAWRGSGWSVRHGAHGERSCYDIEAEVHVLEPMPSARDDHFNRTCRFDLETALDLARRLYDAGPVVT